MEEEKKGWDKGLDLESTYKKFLEAFSQTDSKREKFWITIAITQIRNGCRAGEAVYAVAKWLETGFDQLEIPVEKRKNATRLIYMPKICTKELRESLLKYAQKRGINTENKKKLKRTIESYKAHLIRKYKINSHSLRYAFVTYMLKNGTEPAILAKIIGHSNLHHLLKYVQQKKANEELEKKLNF